MKARHYKSMVGAALTLVALGALVPANIGADMAAGHVIAITAKKYEFAPAMIALKRGEPVTLEFTSQDRAHGFLVKPLGIDMDIAPGKATDVAIKPEAAGTYTAICDHYCGLGHGRMKMTIVVE